MQIYNPFQNFDFHFDKCFLSGSEQRDDLQEKPIIHPVLQASGNLTTQSVKMLDERLIPYTAFTLPIQSQIYEHSILPLETEVIDAFEQGYEKVKTLSPIKIFTWAGMIVYGFIYHELHSVNRLAKEDPEAAQMPQGLVHKFKNLHMMLQNAVLPLRFDGFLPFSVQIVPLAERVAFSFKDDINSLTFSMKMQDVGVVIVLQDNAMVTRYLHQTLIKIQDKKLSLIQFEELCAQFYYASYLMNKLPEYDILRTEDCIYIDARPMAGLGDKRLFDAWQPKVYAQVLENFWQPWGHTLFEILKDPENPMSFL